MTELKEIPQEYKDLLNNAREYIKKHPENASSPDAVDIIEKRVCEVMGYKYPIFDHPFSEEY